MKNTAKQMALGGVTAALAVVLMTVGTLIPIATYMVPVMICLLLGFLRPMLGIRASWAWFLAVALLGLLLAPDKEAAAIFLCLGYYPIIKPWLDKRKLSLLLKLIFFNVVILALYAVLMYVLGMDAIREEFRGVGTVMTIATLLLGNFTFFLMDKLLGGKILRRKR